MSDFLASQTVLFFQSILLGVLLSLFYDVFAVARMMFPQRINPHVLLDILYFLLVGLILFDYVLLENYGRMRLFIALGAAIGWILYHLTISRLVIRFFSWLIGLLGKFLSLLLRPLKPLVARLRRAGKRGRQLIGTRKKQLKYRLKRGVRLLYNKSMNKHAKEGERP